MQTTVYANRPGLWLVAIFLLAAGSWMIWNEVRLSRIEWKEAPGEWQELRVDKRSRSGPGRVRYEYFVEGRFQYTVNDETLTSAHFCSAGDGNRRDTQEGADKLMRELKGRDPLTVRYNPDDPKEAYVIESNQIGPAVFAIWAAMIIITLLGAKYLAVINPPPQALRP